MRAAVALLCVLGIASFGAVMASGASGPNVTGRLVRSSPDAGCYQGEPCDPPPQAAVILFTRNAHSTRAHLGVNGTFAVRLASGLYHVTVFPSQSSALSPPSIRVPPTGVIHPRFVEKTH